MPTPTRKPPHSPRSGFTRLAASTALAVGTAAVLLAGGAGASAASGDVNVVGPLPDSNPPTFTHYGAAPDPISVAAGGSFTITGPGNLWTTGPNGDWASSTLSSALGQCGKDGSIATVELTATPSSDGSTLTLGVPSHMPNTYWDLATIPFYAANAQDGGIQTALLDSSATIDLSGATPTVTFVQDPSDATKITISVFNVHPYDRNYWISTAGTDGPDTLAEIEVASGATGTVTVSSPVGTTIDIDPYCPEARYTVPAGPTATEPSGSLSETTVGQDHSLTVNGTGFEANEPVQIWIHSTPVQLWSGTASAAGTISQSVVIPANIPTGAHQIEIRGATSGSVWLDLTVTQMLPATGLDTTATILLAVGAVATLGAGTVLTIISARRRRARA